MPLFVLIAHRGRALKVPKLKPQTRADTFVNVSKASPTLFESSSIR